MRRSAWSVPASPVKQLAGKALWLGFAAGLISRLARTPSPGVTGADLRRHDYSASTQRIGVRFTERVRTMFRLRWIREIF